jgi:hypothetical protein
VSAIDWVRRNPLLWLGAALVVIAIALSSFVVVPETKQAVVIRFGVPQRIMNAYDRKQDFGHTGAGLAAKMPFVEQLVWVDKRVLDFDMPRQSVLSTDQFRLEVDAFARYRIVNPVRMYVTAQSERRVGDALKHVDDAVCGHRAVHVLRREFVLLLYADENRTRRTSGPCKPFDAATKLPVIEHHDPAVVGFEHILDGACVVLGHAARERQGELCFFEPCTRHEFSVIEGGHVGLSIVIAIQLRR